MTKGNDVSELFMDVTNCIQTDNLELKKLVYLYVMNYAKTQPDLAIGSVNAFVKDSESDNPLIRALAIRTMGCIRVEQITEYLCDPVRKRLRDDDPYVRKTAATCVAKLYDIDAQLVEDQGFIDDLLELLTDSNPMVVSNAVAALAEINNYSEKNLFDLSPGTISKLLASLNECTEWGQIFILDSLSQYSPSDQKEMQSIVERAGQRLNHVNAAVVLAAIKVIVKLLDVIQDQEFVAIQYKRLAPPLVTLLSSEPEIQYVALRNINLVVQKRADILQKHIKTFFVKYNDPVYVKVEKLDILIRLVSSDNIQQVLAELKEYAQEVDVDFVRKSVRAIGRCAIKIDGAAERCVMTLLELIETKINYVVQEAIVVIKDIFRKYPNKYENIIGTLCENLDSLDEPDAKAAMIWIVGEYADRIDNSDELLNQFLETFLDEPPNVQLSLLTATVKLFLKKPTGTEGLVQKVLTMATQESTNPELRDRGFIYWRLLMVDAQKAKEVVLAEKPLISEETDMLEPGLLQELLGQMASLSSIYHKPASSFVDGKVPGKRIPVQQLTGAAAQAAGDLLGGSAPAANPFAASAPAPSDGGLVDLLGGSAPSTNASANPFAAAPTASSGGLLDLLGNGGGGSSLTDNPVAAANPFDLTSLMGGGSGATASSPGVYVSPSKTVLQATAGGGIGISVSFKRSGGKVIGDFTFSNQTSAAVSGIEFQFNKNSFSLTPERKLNVNVPAGGSALDSLPL
eukprot:UC4_evm1s655